MPKRDIFCFDIINVSFYKDFAPVVKRLVKAAVSVTSEIILQPRPVFFCSVCRVDKEEVIGKI